MKKTEAMIPYGRQLIEDDDIAAVVEVLRSDWLTTGPKVGEFEEAVAGFTGAAYGVAVSSGTAALHAAMNAIGIGPGDEVIVPAMTFAATANCVVYQGGVPVFADVDARSLLVDPEEVLARITPRTRAVIAVDYAGHPCPYDRLREICERHDLILVADGCHALGAEYRGRRVGSIADLTVFSFHPVKHITTGEGGMIVTDRPEWAERMRRFRNHGIMSDHRQREEKGTWYYEMEELGFNYRITDLQCALGISQLTRLSGWLAKRGDLARVYDRHLTGADSVSPLAVVSHIRHAYHLYVVLCADSLDRAALFGRLRQRGIGVNVHYLPVHMHPFYRKNYATGPGLCPRAEAAYEQILSLPLHPGLTEKEVEWIATTLLEETA